MSGRLNPRSVSPPGQKIGEVSAFKKRLLGTYFTVLIVGVNEIVLHHGR